MAAALLALAAVGLFVLSFPPFGLWPLALVALAPVAAVMERARPGEAALFTWATQAGMAVVVGRFLVQALAGEYGVPAPAAWAVLALVAGLYALVPAAAVYAAARLRPRAPLALAPLLLGALWTLGEWLRAGPLGLPWLLLGHAVAYVPPLLQTAELGGAAAVGLPLATAGSGVGLALARRTPRPLALPAALLLAASGYGALRLASLSEPERSLRVGVVQAAVPQSERFRPGSARENTLRHVRMTRALAEEGPLDLVVWSETAVDRDLDTAPVLRRALREASAEAGAPILTGAPRRARGARRNSVVIARPEAAVAEAYDKQVLVPFSESDPPLAFLFEPLLGRVMEGEAYEPGPGPTLLRAGPLPIAAPICFEVTYPGLMRRFREAGAALVVNVSNDAWFGRGGYPALHLGHAVLRAVELRTWVVRGANTGISAVIDPAGRIPARLGAFEQGHFRAGVGAAGAAPLYARAGEWPVLAALGLAAGAALAAGRRGRAPTPSRAPLRAVASRARPGGGGP